MNFKNAKILGGISALIMAFGWIPTLLISGFSFNTDIVTYFLDVYISNYLVALIIGMILILFSMHNLSKFYQTKNIFTPACIGVLVAIIAAISYIIVRYILLLPNAALLEWLPFIGVFWVIGVIVAVFVRRSLTELAARSDTFMIGAVGELLFFSAITFIVIVGFILLPIFLILLAIAFFKIKEPKPAISVSKVSTTLTGQ